MVDNLSEKVDECPLILVVKILLVFNWDHKNCPLYVVADSAVQGLLNGEANNFLCRHSG